MEFFGIAQVARETALSEGALRRLERKGVMAPARDPWGRRIYTRADIEAVRRHLAQRAFSPTAHAA